MGLIYVNPEGPHGVPDPLMAGRDIRETYRRMGMNDEETVALIVGRPHVRQDPRRGRLETHLGPDPEGRPLEEQGLGWRSSFGTGNGADAITSGLEGTWTPTPTRWDNSFLETLFGYEWDAVLSPAGAWQWIPSGGGGAGTVPDAHDPSKTHAPTILTTDLALRFDPVLRADLAALPGEPGPARGRLRPGVVQADAPRHGPDPALPRARWSRRSRCSGRTRSPPWTTSSSEREDIAALKSQILGSGLSVSQLVSTAWASASTFRGSDKRGGANGARIRLEPQRGWEVNDPDELAHGAAAPWRGSRRRSTAPRPGASRSRSPT